MRKHEAELLPHGQQYHQVLTAASAHRRPPPPGVQHRQMPYVAKPQLEEQGDPGAIARGIKDQGVAAKLAAAAARRRQRQAQQQQQAGSEGQPGSGSSGGGSTS